MKRIILAACVSAMCAGCSTWEGLDKTEKGAILGGAGGATLGAVTGNTTGALVGGGLGAVGGGLVGREFDKQDEENRRAAEQRRRDQQRMAAQQRELSELRAQQHDPT